MYSKVASEIHGTHNGLRSYTTSSRADQSRELRAVAWSKLLKNEYCSQLRMKDRRSKMEFQPQRTFYTSGNTPPYNLLDHPEFYLLGPSSSAMRHSDLDANAVLESYGSGRPIYQDQQQRFQANPGHRRQSSRSIRQMGSATAASAPPVPPPPYYEGMESESQPLLQDRRTYSLESSLDTFGIDNNGRSIGLASFYAIVAGICYSGCRLLLQNIKLNVIDLTIVGALVQILLSGIFVTLCQCHRLWPTPPAGNKNKLFLVLYAFLYGIMALCGIVVFDMLNQFDAEALTSLTIITTPIMSLLILKEPLRSWKLVFVPLMLASIIVIVKPPLIFNQVTPPNPNLGEDGNFTIGMLAGVVGVAIIGGLANTSVAATGSFVYNGTLIFYAGFASLLVGVLASRADTTQKILTPDIVSIPFINWLLMVSHGFMVVCGTAFFMKSIKTSTPTIAIVLTKLVYIAILYTAHCILFQDIPDVLAIIGICTMVFSSICIVAELAISRRLPACLQRCF